MRRASVRQKCRINRKEDGEEGQPNLMISPCFLDLIAPLLGRSACHLPELYVHSQMLRTQIVRLNSACHTMIVYKSWNVNQTSKKEGSGADFGIPDKIQWKKHCFLIDDNCGEEECAKSPAPTTKSDLSDEFYTKICALFVVDAQQ